MRRHVCTGIAMVVLIGVCATQQMVVVCQTPGGERSSPKSLSRPPSAASTIERARTERLKKSRLGWDVCPLQPLATKNEAPKALDTVTALTSTLN
jgi:hypothetical protein